MTTTPDQTVAAVTAALQRAADLLKPLEDALRGTWYDPILRLAKAPILAQIDPTGLAALEAYAAKVRNDALREAANVDWSHGTDVLDKAPEFLTPWQRGLVAGQQAMRGAILALIDTPPAPSPDPRVAALVDAVDHLLHNYLLDEHDEPDLCVDEKHWSAIHNTFEALAAMKEGEA